MKLTSIKASYFAALWAIYLDYENFRLFSSRPKAMKVFVVFIFLVVNYVRPQLA
jgi:hypothetical protein